MNTSPLQATRLLMLTRSLCALVISTLCSACQIFYPSIEHLAPSETTPAHAILSSVHRGRVTPSDLPDNSLPAIEIALAKQVPYIEVDVRLSKEGDLFLFHDGSLKPGNSLAPDHLYGRQIQSLTKEERALVYLDQARTIPVPLLSSAISLLQPASSSLQLDLKGESDQLIAAVLNLISRESQLANVIIQIRDPARIGPILKAYPKARILARCRSKRDLEEALKYPVEVVELERWLTTEAVHQSHAKGALVLINVARSRFDNHHSWCHLRARGVDIIMSDFYPTDNCDYGR